MSFNQRMTVYVEDLEAMVRLGIYDSEKTPQRIVVNAEMEGDFPAHPKRIEDCFNYELVYGLVINQWQQREHVDLIETLVIELLMFVFAKDARVVSATVSIDKPDIFKEAASVGVEMTWTREDYRRYETT